jgi:thiamine biosynthesis lipoprotein ApbE
MREGVRITTDKRADAGCISEALVDFGSEVKREGKRWAVQVTAPSAPEVTAALAALKNCLDETAIAFVKITIDGQTYAMEGRH